MQRYFAKNLDINNIVLDEDDIFHISKVMRMKVDDQIEVVLNNEVYLCKITSFKPFLLEKVALLKQNSSELKTFIRLLYCLPKGSKIDFVLQKCCELGVDEIVLINSERSIAKIDESNKNSKLIRFNKILKEASEQSKRTNIPILENIIDFKEINLFEGDYNFIAYEKCEQTQKEFYDFLIKNKVRGKTINLIVGAEGGISPKELEIAKKCNYIPISLGSRILRSETSAMYLVSLISFLSDVED